MYRPLLLFPTTKLVTFSHSKPLTWKYVISRSILIKMSRNVGGLSAQCDSVLLKRNNFTNKTTSFLALCKNCSSSHIYKHKVLNQTPKSTWIDFFFFFFIFRKFRFRQVSHACRVKLRVLHLYHTRETRLDKKTARWG